MGKREDIKEKRREREGKIANRKEEENKEEEKIEKRSDVKREKRTLGDGEEEMEVKEGEKER